MSSEWVATFAETLIEIAEASGHKEKAHFARSFAHDIAGCYLNDGALPDPHKNPREAAWHEFKAWRWWV
jgi:hypothetical protein